MKRLGIAFASIGAMLMLLSQIITPAVATHVQEPTAPITGLVLRVEHYATNTAAPCDGSVFPFKNIRIETMVRWTSRPSEHFNQNVRVDRKGKHPEPDWVPVWSSNWSHSNVPPHGAVGVPNHWLTGYPGSNSWLDRPGKYMVSTTVKTLESLQTFKASCIFTVPEGAAG